MITRLLPKLALATVAAIAMYASTLGLPVLGSCLGKAGVADAAPSPTCGGDLRECLRLSAKTGIYGARYVTAEDVATCVEAFNACIHGTLGGGNPNPPASTSAEGRSGKGLPQKFRMSFAQGFTGDCRVNGGMITCAENLEPLPENISSFTSRFTGNVNGLTVTGTEMRHQTGRYSTGCTFDENYSTPVTLVFSPSGTVAMSFGVGQRESTFSCAEPTSGTTPAGEVAGTWSATG